MTKDMNLRDTGIVLSWLSGLLAAFMSSLAGLWGKTGLAALFGEDVLLPNLTECFFTMSHGFWLVGVGLEDEDMIHIRQKLFPPRSPFCCQFFQSLWENRKKHGLSIVVDQNDHQPLFWLQMRGLDSDKEEQYVRIGKATTVDKSKLSVSDFATSCELTLWTRTPIRYCPHCGKNLHRFYGRNWRTLFAPVPEHHMPGITKGE